MVRRWGLSLLLVAAPAFAVPPPLVRGIYANPGAALDNRLWADYGAGYELDTKDRHGGQASLRCHNDSATEAHGAGQTVRLDQDRPRPIVIGGWAKLEGVGGPADYRCSVYLDLTLEGGESWPMKIAIFDPSKSGWQYAERTYTPPKPIVSARVHVFLRERAGTAWFDDIVLAEVLDDAGTRSANRLRDAGFEAPAGGDPAIRDRFFGKLTELGCNAVHVYRHVAWERVMGETPAATPASLPPPDPKDPFLGFVRDAHQRGFKVWATVGLGLPPVRDTKSPWFPFWPCVNGAWGEGYTRAVAYLTQYGVDGIGVVPDEWNQDTSAVSQWAKHPNADVAKFYASIPPLCDCDVCRARFKQQTGLDYPNVRRPWSTTDPAWAALERFRQDSTAAWMARTVAAAKRVNPTVVTDTMICVLPVCSRDRLTTGAAWDQIGVSTGLDCLQTDPYIFLHNYRGDSTHWYPTETMLHLSAANQRGYSGVTLESCRLYDRYRDKEPVEVYGSALSCFAHGAREYFWWYFSYVNGEVKFVDPAPPSAQLAALYKVMADLDEPVRQGRPNGDVAVVYCRAAEDAWDRLEHAKALPAGEWPVKRGFYAHRNMLMWLLRRGVPFRLTFLEHPDPAVLSAAKVLLVPFGYQLDQAGLAVLREQAAAGKRIIWMSEPAPSGVPNLTDLGRDFASNLLQPIAPVKDPQAFVPVPPLSPAETNALSALLDRALGRPASLFAEQPGQDVEVQLLDGPGGQVLLLTNWSLREPATVKLRLNPGSADGWSILPDASVRRVNWRAGEPVILAPQEARMVRWRQ